jgi:hypothetical protein
MSFLNTVVFAVSPTQRTPNYGPFLVSVNGVAGNKTEKAFWELLVQTWGSYTQI